MRRTIAWLVALACIATACGTAPPDHVRIGVIAPLSGDRAFLGQEVRDGARFAVDDLNASGGLLGRDVELVMVDDADLITLPGRLADLAERSRVTAVVGPEAPGVLLGPRSPLTRRGVPAVLPTASTGDLEAASTVLVRTVPSASAQARRLGRWVTRVRGGREVAILVADPLEGADARAALTAGFTAAGATATSLVVDPAALSLRPAVARLRDQAATADLVVLWGPPPIAARATRAVRALGWDVQIAVPASSFVAEYRTLAGAASDGVVLAFPWRPEWFGVDLTTWMLRYHAEHGLATIAQLDTLVLDVPVVAIAAYDAVGVIASAVRAADSRAPADVAEALPAVTHDGLLRTYRPSAAESWGVDDLYVARFLGLGVLYDADPRLDADDQRRFWELQVSGDYLPDAVLEGPAGALLRALLARRGGTTPTYAPPLPPPGPVGRP